MRKPTDATAEMAQRYLAVLERIGRSYDAQVNRYFQVGHLMNMCHDIINDNKFNDGNSMHPHKASRWLGYIQGVMAMRGWIDVDIERDYSRPLFESEEQE